MEFAVVLILNEKHERRLPHTSLTKDQSKSGTLVSRDLAGPQGTVSQVTPVEIQNHDLRITAVTECRQTSFQIKMPKFFEDLPFERKMDCSAFAIYHLTYIIFNVTYWL